MVHFGGSPRPNRSPSTDLLNKLTASDNDQPWSEVLDRLHASDFQIAIVVSGGGGGSLARCFRRPGASKTFVEAVVAYAHRAMAEYLGESPVGQSASRETANQLSRAAMVRCARLSDAESGTFRPIGISLVAALPTSSPRRGEDRIEVSLSFGNETKSWSRNLRKGQFTRESAEDVADAMFLAALSELLECND